MNKREKINGKNAQMEEGKREEEVNENNFMCARTSLDFDARCCENAQIRGWMTLLLPRFIFFSF